jgi:hypothetical protein
VLVVIVGSMKTQRLTDEEIAAEYRAGKSQAWLGLKARLSSAQVRSILVALQVPLRSQQEVLRLALRTRRYTPPRERA